MQAAQPIGAELFALADQAHQGPRWIGEITRTIVNNPFSDFWWD